MVSDGQKRVIGWREASEACVVNENRRFTVMGYADECNALEELFGLLGIDGTAVDVAKSVSALWKISREPSQMHCLTIFSVHVATPLSFAIISS